MLANPSSSVGRLLVDLFGKAGAVSGADLQALIDGSRREGDGLDVKRLEGCDLKAQRAALIVKPLVGFLNKLDASGGVLVLGMAETKQVISGFSLAPSGEYKEEQIRDWVLQSVRSTPSIKDWHLDVQRVAVGGGDAFVLEVYPSAIPALYYSSLDDTAYHRRGDKTDAIGLAEALEVAKLRARSVVGVELKLTKFEPSSAPKAGSGNWTLAWNNRGSLPGRDVYSLITAHNISADTFRVDLGHGQNAILKAGERRETALQAHTGSPGKPPVFPGRGTSLGSASIYGEGQVSASLTIVTHDEFGQTVQHWMFVGDMSKVIIPVLQQEIYSPY